MKIKIVEASELAAKVVAAVGTPGVLYCTPASYAAALRITRRAETAPAPALQPGKPLCAEPQAPN